MKKLLYGSLVLFSAIFCGCGDKLLTETNLRDELVDNYYRNQVSVDRALVGVYSELYTGQATNNEVMMANLASDEMFGGGEPGGDLAAKAVDGFIAEGDDMFNNVWESSYRGIYRASLIIDNIDKATYTSEAAKKDDAAEARFMRAYYYFRLAKYFGGVPVFADASEQALKKARSSFDDVFAFIAADLKNAIESFSTTAYTPNSTDYGKANKWIAQGYLARVYLFYTGYKTNTLKEATTVLPVFGSTTPISKQMAIDALKNCKEKGGYALESNFCNLWPYSKAAELGFYKWTGAEGSKWDGDGAGKEKMFVIRHGKGFWDKGNQKVSNILCLYSGIRDLSDKLENVPFGPGGWGWCTVSKKAVTAAFTTTDVRQKGSVIDLADPDDMKAGYDYKGDQVTGYVNKKYTQIQWKDQAKNEYYEIWHHLFLAGTDKQLNDMQDLCLLRYADILLMLSELTGIADDGLTAVRVRVGLDAVNATLENIKAERRREFAFEGLRWYDMLRFGTAKADIAAVNGETVKSAGAEKKYSVDADRLDVTKGLWQIPGSQLRVTGGDLYTQNPGW